jgi:hypothetical protein
LAAVAFGAKAKAERIVRAIRVWVFIGWYLGNGFWCWEGSCWRCRFV